MRNLTNFIRELVARANKERPSAAANFVFRGFFDAIRGRVAANIAGWPKSYLGPDSKVIGTRAITVAGNAYIQRDAWIEAVFSYLDQSFEPVISIGRGFGASDRLHITCINRIEIGDNCLFGSGVFIGDHNHGSYKGDVHSHPSVPPLRRRLVSGGAVIIGSNVWLGDNVTIIGPVRIGDGAVIGANTVVNRDIPENVIAAGSPAQILKRFNDRTERWENI